MTEAMRILIIKPSSMGDIFHIFPALALLKKQYPTAQFDLVVNPEFAELADFAPVKIERKILFNRKDLGKIRSFLPALFQLLRELRREKYDLIIDFQGLWRSAALLATARLKKSKSIQKMRCGFANPREKHASLLYRFKAHVPVKGHAIEKNFELARVISNGAEGEPVIMSDIPLHQEAADFAATKLRDDGKKLIAVIPGARWSSKAFDPGFFARIIRKVDKAAPGRFRWAIIGAKSDKNRAKKICENTKECDIVNLTGKTSIPQMTEVLRKCDGILSNDSGPMHVGAALKKPVAALFASSNPEATGPYWPETKVFRREELDCIGCRYRKCPGKNMECHNLEDKEVVNFLLTFGEGNKNA